MSQNIVSSTAAANTVDNVTFKVVRFEDSGNIARIIINEGCEAVGYSYVESIDGVSATINALKDWKLGLYQVPERGLHLHTRKGASLEDVGYVCDTYEGQAVNAPKAGTGWLPLRNYGKLSLMGFGRTEFRDNDSSATRARVKDNYRHQKRANMKHAMLDRIVAGETIVLKIGAITRKIAGSAIEIMAMERGDALAARDTKIRGKVTSDRVWNAADKDNPAPESVEVILRSGEGCVNMAELEDGVTVNMWNKRGNPLGGRTWKNTANNMRFFASFAKGEGTVEIAV